MKYLSVPTILRLHHRVIARHGGDPTIRDRGAIEAACSQPRMTFGGRPLYLTIVDKAAALGFALNKNHPFTDGNKRTSFVATLMLLARNGYKIAATIEDRIRVWLDVADGSMDRAALVDWLRRNVIRRR
jgi:death-on-curing protein